MARNETHIESSFKGFQVTVAYDETNTKVTVYTNEPFAGDTPVAEGRARRRKGDPRDLQLGLALATGRAFQQLADREIKFAKERLGEEGPGE